MKFCIMQKCFGKISQKKKKMEILRWHEENGSAFHKTSKEFQLDCKCLQDSIKNRDMFEMNQFRQNKKKEEKLVVEESLYQTK